VFARIFGPRTDSARGAWRLLSSEAHRTMFFFGALQAVAAMAWWSLDLGGRYLGLYAAPAWSVPPMWAHAWLLLYALFPFFMFGFLMTAGPNWLGAPKTARIAYVPAALLMACGIVLFYTGLAVDRVLAGAGMFLHVAGWLWGLGALVHMLVRHWNPNARYALMIFAFLALGVTGDALVANAIAMGSYGLLGPVLHGAVWFFLLPVFAGVSTRMVPFFSSRVLGPQVDYRPGWARPMLMAGTIIHGVLELLPATQWLWSVDLPLAGAVTYLAWRWGALRSGRVRLLAVLHVSLAVLALAFLLSGVMSAAVAARALERVGLAPLHLLTIGYFAAMTLGMVSRVSLGHSGRPLEADPLTWGCYLGVLAAAVLRVLAEFTMTVPAGRFVMGAAALAWLAAFGVWAWRYVPMYVVPRVDARR
jgi:uncharacterized protein involved in response to NO